MLRPIKALVALSTLLIISCASGPSEMTYDSPIGIWSEKYDSGGGTLTAKFTIIDESKGKYTATRFPARIEFFSIGKQGTWKGYWIGEQSKHACLEEKGGSKFWGVNIYRFNETYTRYNGTWDYCGEDRKYTISGFR